MTRLLGLTAAAVAFTFNTGVAEVRNDTSDSIAEQEVRQVAQQWLDALTRQDATVLTRILADDYLHIDRVGRRLSKTEWIAAIVDPPPSREQLVEPGRATDVETRVVGDVVLMSNGTRPRFRQPDGRITEAPRRVTRVWVRRNMQWQLLLFQESADAP